MHGQQNIKLSTLRYTLHDTTKLLSKYIPCTGGAVSPA